MTLKINEDTKLNDLIVVQKNLIPPNICSFIVDDIEKNNWEQHTWYDNLDSSVRTNKTGEPSIQPTSLNLQNILEPYINEALKRYFFHIEENPFTVSKSSLVRFNKYEIGQEMRIHTDHIKSLFTPPEQGIPVLSMIIHFNQDYEGGNLIFWDDYVQKLETGDIIIWPSLFLYPHKVTKIISGKRYTGVVWFW
jgi:predicted 2-oxoglutarate/Fe(II)-dependent dioxygenase YbiX